MTEHSTLSEPIATPPDATDASLPPPTLVEVLRKRIADAATPLKFSDLKKDLKKAKKQTKEAFEAEIRQLLDEDIRAGLAFEHPAKKATDPPLYGSTPYRAEVASQVSRILHDNRGLEAVQSLFYSTGRASICLCFLSACLGESHVKHASRFRRAFAVR